MKNFEFLDEPPDIDELKYVLESIDEEHFKERLERFIWLNKTIPGDYACFSKLETYVVRNEAWQTYVNGHYVATIVLSQAFIEHWLAAKIEEKGFVKQSKLTLKKQIQFSREYNIVHPYLLDLMNQIREIRNPFTHPKKLDHKHSLTNRSIAKELDIELVLKKDAQKAITLMFHLGNIS